MVDPTIVCRICLKGDVSTSDDIFLKTRSKKPTYSSMMATLFSLPVSQGDRLPSKLCNKCRVKLISAYNLRLLAEKSYNTLLRNAPSEFENTCFKEERIIAPISKIEIKNEIDSEVFGDSIIKQEYLEVVFDVSGSNKDEGVDDHLEDDRSLGYEDEDDTPLNLLHCDSEDIKENVTEVKKQRKKTKKKIDSEDTKKNVAVKRQRKKLKKKIGEKRERKKKDGVCEVCGKYVADLSEHSQTHSENRKKYVCRHCPREFNTFSGRKHHIDVTHLKKSYYCELCDKYVKRMSNHILYVHREKLFTCETCKRSFSTRNMLINHIATHTRDVPPSFCDVCGKMFKNKYQCNTHRKRVHDKEKPFSCELCSKTFFTASHLKAHMRSSHNNEKIYKCKECNKSYMTSFGLLMHTRLHSGIKNFTCKLCSSKFVNAGALKTHMISHTKEKKHPCRYCNVMFGRTDHRNRHERTAHLNKLNTTQLHKKNITDSLPDDQLSI